MRTLALIAALLAQTTAPPPKPVYEYAGNAMTLAAACADEEIHDFGLTCSDDEPCPVYLEIAWVEPVGVKLFAAGNFHTERATLWSVLLASDDNGRTWSEPVERMRMTTLDGVQFFDFETGWVSGQQHGALSRDPFLLRSSDGGKTWRKAPLYDDSTVAAIDQFWFDSRTQGQVILKLGGGSARHQRMETMNGGDTWMMREISSQAIAGKRVRGATANNADWRARADGPAKAIKIERRDEGKWQTVAAFAIAAGGCRPKPPEPEIPKQP